jgi:hypothetical protein
MHQCGFIVPNPRMHDPFDNYASRVRKGFAAHDCEKYPKKRPEDFSQAAAPTSAYCSFAYSALACFRMGMSWSASFHGWGQPLASRLRFLQENDI